MDNKKIGQLISKLRKQKGLTQEQLGDMVGVGFRAVSKWERGITLPDISIINSVSKVLGITSDELLAGELNENKEDIIKFKHKDFKKLKIIIPLILLLLIITFVVFFYFKNKSYVYEMQCEDISLCSVNGEVTFVNNKIIIDLNSLKFNDEYINSIKVKNYEYKIYINKKFTFGYGYIDGLQLMDNSKTIQQFNDDFDIYYDGNYILSKGKILKSGIILKLKFLTEDDKNINIDIKILLKSNSVLKN